ncbi:hypothetical protein pneo_cds_809 [Pandoravirus neocaledonia]|uniref:Uncharacterized protein n=1 Tax=Pandoravirus neocaledonia TaxID=2107708 RepID=A0A2U7UDA8_9VIRU|nr:hypothetical protein pneo_cds_809 [Pandoravirus neocaledonia]AVK76416.1 hypothetical protein pneo_cds_809 [Pandoravirus neocaledonia]
MGCCCVCAVWCVVCGVCGSLCGPCFLIIPKTNGLSRRLSATRLQCLDFLFRKKAYRPLPLFPPIARRPTSFFGMLGHGTWTQDAGCVCGPSRAPSHRQQQRQQRTAYTTTYDGAIALANVRAFPDAQGRWTAPWAQFAMAPERPIVARDAACGALATVVCLMEGYARFLFSNQQSAEARGLDPEEVSRARSTRSTPESTSSDISLRNCAQTRFVLARSPGTAG